MNDYYIPVWTGIQTEDKGIFKPNGSQLAKMKKSIPDMSLSWNL